EPLSQNRFFFRRKLVVFDFDCTTNQFLSFGKRELRNFGEDFGQAHPNLTSCDRKFFGAAPSPRRYRSSHESSRSISFRENSLSGGRSGKRRRRRRGTAAGRGGRRG